VSRLLAHGGPCYLRGTMRIRRFFLLPASVSLAAVAAACGSPPHPAPPTSGSAAPVQDADVCVGSPPLPHAPLQGVLRNARCDQDMYQSMAQVETMLGVECDYCHVAKVEGQKERDFPVMTHNKEIANWMSVHLMQSIKSVDGSPIKCSSCHTDDRGQPVAKILGQPRDRVKANEWMSLVMVKKFVAADGSKLRCKSCHAGTPGTPEYRPAVILQTDQLPRHAPGVKGSLAF
jgi:hypothetical protein